MSQRAKNFQAIGRQWHQAALSRQTRTISTGWRTLGAAIETTKHSFTPPDLQATPSQHRPGALMHGQTPAGTMAPCDWSLKMTSSKYGRIILAPWSPSKSGNRNGTIFTQLGRHFRQKSKLELFCGRDGSFSVCKRSRRRLFRGRRFLCLFMVSYYKKKR